MEFYDWVRETKVAHRNRFNSVPDFPTFSTMNSEVQERMMRCGIEQRFFKLQDDIDATIVLACCTMLKDNLRENRRTFRSFTIN